VSGWLYLALLALILTAIAAVGVWFDRPYRLALRRIDDAAGGRPRRYRGRHRWPSPAHPAHAAWLDMQREQLLADDRVIAELEAMLEEEDHR